MSTKPSAAAVQIAKTSSIFDVDIHRPSKAFPAGQSTTSFTYEPGHQDDKNSKRAAYYEPTYRLAPRMKFKPQLVTNIINSVLEEKLAGKTYNPEKAGEECKVVASEIQRVVKRQKFDRYKYVVNVTIGQKSGQAVDISSRCTWDKESDSMASGYYESPTFYAVAIVFGVFFE